MTDKLLNCPFCGGEANIIAEPILGAYQVYCTECPVNVGRYWFFKEEDAVKAWNTRKPMDRIVEQLEEEKNHCCVGSYEDYDPYEDGRFETYEEVIALLKGVQNE